MSDNQMTLQQAIKVVKNMTGPVMGSRYCDEYNSALNLVLSAAEKQMEIEGWAKTPSGIWNDYTAAGYANAQFDVMQIIEGSAYRKAKAREASNG
jgi:hypothetical protein